jgi:hypothetical protein
MKKAPTAASSGMSPCAVRIALRRSPSSAEENTASSIRPDMIFGNDRWRYRSCGYKADDRVPLLYQVEAGHDALDPTVTPAGTGDLL